MAAGRLGLTNDQGRWVEGPIEPTQPAIADAAEVDRIVTVEASRLVADHLDAVDQERVEVGDRAAR